MPICLFWHSHAFLLNKLIFFMLLKTSLSEKKQQLRLKLGCFLLFWAAVFCGKKSGISGCRLVTLMNDWRQEMERQIWRETSLELRRPTLGRVSRLLPSCRERSPLRLSLSLSWASLPSFWKWIHADCAVCVCLCVCVCVCATRPFVRCALDIEISWLDKLVDDGYDSLNSLICSYKI